MPKPKLRTKIPHRLYLASKIQFAANSRIALVGAVIVIAGAGLLAAKFTHLVSAASVPTQIICNYGTPNGVVCLNRYQGRTGSNAGVVGYFKDFDLNENFQFTQLYQMCNGGYVSSTCPFTVGTGLNNRYINDMILQIKDTATGMCVGNDVFNSGYTAEEKCNSVSGSGGGNGTIFIRNIAGGGGTAGYMESRYWSDQYRKPAWLCSNGYPSDPRQIFTNSTADFGGGCQWRYVSK